MVAVVSDIPRGQCFRERRARFVILLESAERLPGADIVRLRHPTPGPRKMQRFPMRLTLPRRSLCLAQFQPAGEAYMRDLNIIRLRGRLGKDAESKTTTGNKKVTALSIATPPRYLDKQKHWKDGKTEWHRCYASGQTRGKSGHAQEGRNGSGGRHAHVTRIREGRHHAPGMGSAHRRPRASPLLRRIPAAEGEKRHGGHQHLHFRLSVRRIAGAFPRPSSGRRFSVAYLGGDPCKRALRVRFGVWTPT